MSPTRFRGDIEGLRGLAVALVVAEHVWGSPHGGFVGVDVFFVVSGYVITAGLLREYERTGTVSFRDFSVRRVRRLLPAALVTIVVTVVVARLVFYTPRFLQVLWDAAASATSVQNWRLIRQGTDYFSSGGASPLQHFWSLSVEEQFYVFWPLLFLAVATVAVRWGRDPRRALALVAGAAVVLSFAASLVESALRPGWSYFSLESRVWELGVGVLLALLAPRIALLPHRRRGVLFAVGVAVIVAGAVFIDGSMPFPGPWALVPVLGTAAVIAAGERSEDRWSVVLANTPLRYLGRVSYSLYLWHFPVVVFAGTLLWWSEPLAALVAVIVSLVLADLSSGFVEKPFRRTRRREADRSWSRSRETALALTVVVVVIAVIGVQMRGPAAIVNVPEAGASSDTSRRAPAFVDAGEVVAAVQRSVDAAAWSDTDPGPDGLWPSSGAAQTMGKQGCLVEAQSAAESVEDIVESCSFGTEDALSTAVVFGDSIAISWLPSVVDALVPRGWRVVGVGVQSCPAVSVSSSERVGRAEFTALCATARQTALAEIERMNPDLVVLSSALGSFERLSSGADGAVAAGEWRDGLDTTIDALADSTESIAVLSSPPETHAVQQCASPLLSPASCETGPSDEWFEKTEAEEAAVNDADETVDVRFVPVVDWFCTDTGVCPAIVDGTIVTVDGGHLTEAFAERLALVVRQSLAEVVPIDTL